MKICHLSDAQAEIFVDLLQPKRIIPMHYWTVSYKNKFRNHLKLMSYAPDKNYKILNENSADYYLSSEDMDVTPVQIVSLTPAVFTASALNDATSKIPVLSAMN